LHNDRAIGDVLLDQRVVAGIGNIWKCESLFAAGIDPRARTGSLTHDKLAQLYAAAHDLMTASVRGDRGAYRVYLQHQCTVCGSAIESARLGEPPRWTWWCPRCQPTASGC
jgi:endonuclease-8